MSSNLAELTEVYSHELELIYQPGVVCHSPWLHVKGRTGESPLRSLPLSELGSAVCGVPPLPLPDCHRCLSRSARENDGLAAARAEAIELLFRPTTVKQLASSSTALTEKKGSKVRNIIAL